MDFHGTTCVPYHLNKGCVFYFPNTGQVCILWDRGQAMFSQLGNLSYFFFLISSLYRAYKVIDGNTDNLTFSSCPQNDGPLKSVDPLASGLVNLCIKGCQIILL